MGARFAGSGASSRENAASPQTPKAKDMSVTDDDIAFVVELFEPLGPVTWRKMMGGLSIYLDGTIFAIRDSEGTLYLKAKGPFAEELAAHGARIFGQGGKTMGYWTLPDDAVDDRDAASDWARRALENL